VGYVSPFLRMDCRWMSSCFLKQRILVEVNVDWYDKTDFLLSLGEPDVLEVTPALD
jgi:hypothetical protein